MSQYETEVTEGVFPLGGVNDALAEYFSGTSYMNTLVNDPDVSVTVANVSFEPGVRNNWHKHNGGFQIILATAGEGWYQEEGQPPIKLHAGDVALAKDGVKHWHGATADSWFSHLVITAGMAEWLEPVGDDEYTEIHEYR